MYLKPHDLRQGLSIFCGALSMKVSRGSRFVIPDIEPAVWSQVAPLVASAIVCPLTSTIARVIPNFGRAVS